MIKRSKADIAVATLDRVSPDQLEFDPQNPRFSGDAAEKSQEEIQKMLLEAPLVVRRKGDRYVVIEGNRRLAAVKLIRQNLGAGFSNLAVAPPEPRR